MSIHRHIAVLTLALSITPAAWASGIPTFDATTVAQLKLQLDQLKDQYSTLRQQYSAVIGSYGRGVIGLNESIQSASVVPGSWQDVVALQKSGAYGGKQAQYDKLLNTMPAELFQNPKSQSAKNYQLSTDSVRAAMAGGDSLYGEVQTHLNNLAKLSQQVDRTTNIKDAQDLQNRIATENGMLQSAMGKMQAMNLNLQANLMNQMNQSNAQNQQFYKWQK
ncbi:hypothetical protein BUE93_20310 [Chromobacterium amazonense]|uniref:Type VI secretion protein n=1 Tax=Chromobacterium amazonense TaxID=1382803 RepID=A0A2S9WZA4_9NEIS|nr:type IV secretion system protein [Chromobacterium amazonense]PRP68793.1 hypothetical protein BUE93_20310 [Chromobacterium amazonense]